MMAAAREWLTAVVAAALLLSAVEALVPAGALREMAGFLGGLVLLITLVQPVLHADLSALELELPEYRRMVEESQQALTAARQAELTGLIESGTASYISDKAAALGLELQVRVTARAGADGIPVPCRVEVTGPRSEALARWMEAELGIPAEGQVWNEG